MVFRNEVPMRIFYLNGDEVTEGWRKKQCNKEIHHMYFLQNISGLSRDQIEEDKTGEVYSKFGEVGKYKFSLKNQNGKAHSEYLRVDGKYCGGCGKYIHLPKDKDQ